MVFRIGAIALNDKLVEIDNLSVDIWSVSEVQNLLNRPIDSIKLGFQRERQTSPFPDDVILESERRVVPSSSKLNLIDIRKVITEMITTTRNKE